VVAAVSHRRAVFCAAAALYTGVFVAFVLVGSPSLGIGHFFYLPIALVALVTSPRGGALAGVIGAGLYGVAIVLNPQIPSAEAVTIGTAIRLVNYCSTGALVGWFASRNRRLVAELTILAERDSATGLPNTRAFEASIDGRLASGEPFALLIGDLGNLGGQDERDDVSVNDAIMRLADVLGNVLAPGDELARVGGREFAVLAQATSMAEASRLAGRLETVLGGQGIPIRFGWAVHPQEGLNALSLYRAADERLYARKLIGGDLGAAASLRSVS
jgi:diguanylate cyclase (GGDEF)-like protein